MRLPLSTLVIEPKVQSRFQHLDTATVNRYRAVIKAAEDDPKGIPFPPVTVARLGSAPTAPLYLVDGFHRHAAHVGERVETILCAVAQVESLEEALWLAAKGNLGHGKALSNKELREAFRRFIGARRHLHASPNASPKVVEQRVRPNVMTLGEIGAEIGKTKETIRVWMEKDFLKEYRRLYAKGREELGESWENNGPNPMLSVAPSSIDLVRMSLDNVTERARQEENEDGRRAITEALGQTLAELSQLWGREEVVSALHRGWPVGYVDPLELRKPSDF